MRRASPAFLLERPWPLLALALLLQWVSVLAIAVRSSGVDLGVRETLNVFVLGPLALALAFRIGERVGGMALGAWTLLVWVGLPWLAPLFTLTAYDQTLREAVLPLVVGLTPEAGYVEGVALLAALALVLDRRRVAVAAGIAVVAALAAVWLTRLPPPELSVDAFKGNMAGLREYFWSHRVLQWLPIAGVVAVSRRSPALALALGCWVGAYVALRAAQPTVGLEQGELFRVLLPALPAYALLAAALPLLVPTLAARLGALARPAA